MVPQIGGTRHSDVPFFRSFFEAFRCYFFPFLFSVPLYIYIYTILIHIYRYDVHGSQLSSPIYLSIYIYIYIYIYVYGKKGIIRNEKRNVWMLGGHFVKGNRGHFTNGDILFKSLFFLACQEFCHVLRLRAWKTITRWAILLGWKGLMGLIQFGN